MSEFDSNIEKNLGISRRDLLKRGAIVGGTLVWAAPVVQSLSRSALAQQGGGGHYTCVCCYCSRGGKVEDPFHDLCSLTVGPEECEAFCVSGGFTASRTVSCSGTDDSCSCSSKDAGDPAPFGCECT